MSGQPGILAKWHACCDRCVVRLRLFIFRTILFEMIGIAILFIAVLSAGILIGTYWTCLAVFIRSHDLGEMMLKSLPVLGATGGIVVFLWQVHRARYNQQIDLILKLAERFDREEMRTMRANAAKALRKNPKTEDSSIIEVLNYFEDIGFLLTRKAVDDDAVYEFFSYWAMRYFVATEELREELNQNVDAPLYGKMHKLFETMKLFLIMKKGSPVYDEKTIDDFLIEETKLIPHSQVRKKFSVANNVSRQRLNVSRRG